MARAPQLQAHPWHGISPGDGAPALVRAFIEITPTDTVKYELDKASGCLKVDRPQKYSNVCPSLYGFIPRTYCAEEVARLSAERLTRPGIVGDGDPLDICVLSEKDIAHPGILLNARPIGGLRMIDRAEADDKIVAVMEGDAVYGGWRDIGDCPKSLIDRLRHYFLTYKQSPDATAFTTEVTHVYDRAEALDVIERARRDYAAHYPDEATSG